MKREIQPGSEVDSFCTKCKRVTGHRVMAIHEGAVKRVICLSCQGQHNFRPPAKEPVPRPAKTAAVRKSGKNSGVRAPSALKDWVERAAGLESMDPPRPYSMTASYAKGDAILHPSFGVGFILGATENRKVTVLFEHQVKTLVMNRQDPSGTGG